MMLLAIGVCTTNADAQTRRKKETPATLYKAKADSTNAEFAAMLHAVADSILEGKNDAALTTLSPYLYQLTGANVYYTKPVKDMLKVDYTPGIDSEVQMTSTEAFEHREELLNAASAALVFTYVNNPSIFKHTDRHAKEEAIIVPSVIKEAKKDDIDDVLQKKNEITDVQDIIGDVDVDIEITKPNFWDLGGKFSAQLTQNYFTSNWHQGGNNNVTLLTNLVLRANYNNQRGIQWDNKLDMRLGFVTTTSDSCHDVLTSNDRIMFNSKLDIRAIKKWYYTTSVELQTQFLPGYKSNDPKKYSGFAAPLDVFASIGMDYKPTFKNGSSLSIEFFPFSYRLRYIGSDDENIHKSYNMIDVYTKNDFGSKVVANANVKIIKNFYWKCRAYYYTTYKMTEAELENSLSFQFNKYLSTEIYTLWRFDDSRNIQFKDPKLGFFQFKEYLTFGLAYNF